MGRFVHDPSKLHSVRPYECRCFSCAVVSPYRFIAVDPLASNERSKIRSDRKPLVHHNSGLISSIFLVAAASLIYALPVLVSWHSIAFRSK